MNDYVNRSQYGENLPNTQALYYSIANPTVNGTLDTVESTSATFPRTSTYYGLSCAGNLCGGCALVGATPGSGR
jgi:hypothetical protein